MRNAFAPNNKNKAIIMNNRATIAQEDTENNHQTNALAYVLQENKRKVKRKEGLCSVSDAQRSMINIQCHKRPSYKTNKKDVERRRSQTTHILSRS